MASTSHPRDIRYPHHADYSAQANEFRPFLTVMHQAGYRSASLNTDDFGFREQYDGDNQKIHWLTCRDRYPECTVLIGNSTSFGVDASSDAFTLPKYLHTQGRPCINLSIRGATSQQELASFMVMHGYLPPIRDLVIFSGVVNISMAALKAAIFYPQIGSVFSEKEHFCNFFNQYEAFTNKPDDRIVALLKRTAERAFHRSRIVRALSRRWFRSKASQIGLVPDLDFTSKREILTRRAEDDIRLWAALQKGYAFRVHYVLQPVVRWTTKPLTPTEQAIIDADMAVSPANELYLDRAVYQAYRDRLQHACSAGGIAFHDANEWLNGPQYASADIFTDVCHISDEGTTILGSLLRDRLNWSTGVAP